MVFVLISLGIRNKNIIISDISIMTVTYQHRVVSNLYPYLNLFICLTDFSAHYHTIHM